jgi:hypothetical protein
MDKPINNENNKICSECGGHCCKRMPGTNHPMDFDYDKNKIREALREHYCIDYLEGDPNIYYVRPRTNKAIDKKVDPSWGGQCHFLNETCVLTFEERPLNCRELSPAFNKECGGTDKKLCANWWKDYQDFLKEEVEK